MGPYFRYTALRLVLLLALLGIFYAIGARGLLLIVLAAVSSMALSYLLLRKQRDEVVNAMIERRNRPASKGGDELAEDALDAR